MGSFEVDPFPDPRIGHHVKEHDLGNDLPLEALEPPARVFSFGRPWQPVLFQSGHPPPCRRQGGSCPYNGTWGKP